MACQSVEVSRHVALASFGRFVDVSQGVRQFFLVSGADATGNTSLRTAGEELAEIRLAVGGLGVDGRHQIAAIEFAT